MKSALVAVFAGLAFAAAATAAPDNIDTGANAKIRAEAEKNSQIMRTMHYLTDV